MKSAAGTVALGVSLAIGFGQSIPDSLDQYRKDLEAHRNSSLAHFRIAEILSQQGNYQAAANEFREALSGDQEPRWTEVWAHIGLAKIYDLTSQRARAINEYQLAVKTGDDTQGALIEATDNLRSMNAVRSLNPGFVQTVSSTTVRNAPSSLLSRTEPEYSDEARLAELEGTVVISASAGEDGRPMDLRVTQSLGLGLDEKALEVVQQWRFKPDTKTTSVAVDFSLTAKQSRWHLIGVDFRPPEGTSRPGVLSAYYPTGAGVFNGAAIEEGRLLGAIGRQAFVALTFDVDEQGVPIHIQAERSSESVWNDQAAAVLRGWRFTPGMKDGMPVSVPCTFDFAWGPRILGLREVAQLRGALYPRQPLSDDAIVPKAIYSPDPLYPEEARNAGLEGTVTATFTVGEDGTPRDIRVTQGLGASVDGSVTEALGQWRFSPPLLNGQAASVLRVIRVKFELPGRVSSIISAPPSRR